MNMRELIIFAPAIFFVRAIISAVGQAHTSFILTHRHREQ